MSSPGSAESLEGPFSQEELLVLKQNGYLLGNPSGGKRKVSALLLTPSDHSSFGSVSSTSSSSSSGASTSLRLKGYVNPPAGKNFDLIDSQESVAALEYMGFNHVTAEEIYMRWSTREAHYPYSFLEHATGPFQTQGPNDMSPEAFMTVSA